MEKRNKSEKNNKKVYACLFGVLVSLAVIVGVTGAVSNHRSNNVLVSAEDEIESNADVLINNGYSDNVDDVWLEGNEDGDGANEASNKEPDTEKVDTADAFESDDGALPSGAEDEDFEKTEPDKSVSSDGEIPQFRPPVGGAVIVSFSDTTPVFSSTMNDYRTHSGVDIEAEEGSAVLSCADGVIGAVWDDPMMGKCLTVVHSGGAVSTYKGLYETLPDGIEKGVWVYKGDVIAAVGDTALVEVGEESHVHYELSIGGKNVDPTEYIEFSAVMNYED